MLVELLGLPGAGKSSVIATLESTEPQRFRGLRNHAHERLADLRQKLRFLRGRPERINTYGAFHFRTMYPEVFDMLIDAGPEQIKPVLWNLELMAQYHFATLGDPVDGTILIDEGFVHRGVAHFLGREGKGFSTYIASLPKDFAIILLKVPVPLAIERAGSRPRGAPAPWADHVPRDLTIRTEAMHSLIEAGLAVRRENGLPVGEVDATGSLEDVAAAVRFTIAALD